MSLTERYQLLLDQIKSGSAHYQANPDQANQAQAAQSLACTPPLLCAVTKNQPLESLEELYRAGCRDFAENRLGPFLAKKAALEAKGFQDIRWHFIGHIQSNKLAKIARHSWLIHSVDTFELALKFNQYALAQQVKIKILLQVNISGESSKQGLSPHLWTQQLKALTQLQGLEIHGLMTMAPQAASSESLSYFFEQMKKMQQHFQLYLPQCRQLSMGMSQDFRLALLAGSTLVRLGSILFNP